jgi:ribonucleoside-diphosphate reductase alpha chain
MVGTGRRNSHTTALAPTANNAIIVGTSPTIEPENANVFVQQTRVGSFLVKNKFLQGILKQRGMDTSEIWKSITHTNTLQKN